ncbi:MAG TPA: potassium transporter Kup [Hyphomonadaceae bacterium]|nr:potassium transporter Kup [Hyphomonadaceae bacterium]
MSDTSSLGGVAQAATRHKAERRFWALALGSIGVVFGDIGTSPLYAFKESIHHIADARNGVLSRTDVMGVVSLMIWSLIIIVTLKYVTLLMRMDNRGEGGTLSLMALVQRTFGRRTMLLFLVAVCSAGMFYGDALLTPAVSVLSAVEGLTVIPQLQGRIEPFILPLALVILIGLFLFQKRGTAMVGALFGPICLVWFLTLAGLGLYHIWLDGAAILWALSPHHAVVFLSTHSVLGFVVLGSVFLTVTGAEALYADMGHFGRKPIAATWLWIVFPALAINYLGQGAMVLNEPATVKNPFFEMAPDMLQAPLVVLATLATVVASQAVITGAYSLTQQAVQLGLLPRLRIINTSDKSHGQIYMPQVNYILLAGVVILVLAFKSSSAMANAYGVSVIGAMITSSILALIAVHRVWKKPWWLAVLLVLPFLVVESVFLASNLLKLPQGGYVPLLIASLMILVMWTWVRGSRILSARSSSDITVEDVLNGLKTNPPHTVKGTAIFLTGEPGTAPTALLHNLKHNKVLHEQNVLLTVRAAQEPYIADDKKIEIVDIADNMKRISMTFGYMETPNVARGLSLAKKDGLSFDIMQTSFFLSKRTILADGKFGMPLWQDHLYIFLNRNATNATEFFHIPTSRVVELGTQMAL